MTNDLAEIKAIVIDDEKSYHKTLKRILKRLDANVDLIGTAENVADGIQLVENKQPDIVFLDICLPDGEGFEVIEKSTYNKFEVIFITAFEEHAVKAFNYAALHFLLKPFKDKNLEIAIKRYLERPNQEPALKEKLKIYLDNNTSSPTKILLNNNEGFKIIILKDIIRCEASNNYTTFFMNDKSQYSVAKTIGYYEKQLCDEFVRIHKQHIVNLNYVKEYIKGRGGQIILTNNQIVPVAERRKNYFLEALNDFIAK